jgi:hypothetical protein
MLASARRFAETKGGPVETTDRLAAVAAPSEASRSPLFGRSGRLAGGRLVLPLRSDRRIAGHLLHPSADQD